jgi:hypothetical protein
LFYIQKYTEIADKTVYKGTSMKVLLAVLISTLALRTYGAELLVNGDFNTGNLDHWYSNLISPSDSVLPKTFTWGTDIHFVLANGGTNIWDVQIYQPIAIRAGYRYSMSIGGSGLLGNKPINFSINHNGGTVNGGDGNGDYSAYTALSVTLPETGYVEFKKTWDNLSVNDPHARVQINGGGNNVDYSIAYVSIGESPIAPSSVEVTVNGGAVINTLSDHFFGLNYWMWTPTWGNEVAGTEPEVSALKIKLLRFGGISPDLAYPDPVTSGVLSTFAAYCKAVNTEPLLQLQLARFSASADRAASAALMLDTFKSLMPVGYVSIGNEPDLYSDNLSIDPDYKASYLSGYSLSDYCADFNAVAAEIRKKSPDVKTIGLELSWKRDQWIPGFVSACKNNLDMISIHYYPLPPAQCVYDTVRNQVSVIRDFYTSVRTLIDRNAGGKTIPLVIGETNVSYDGDPAKSTQNASPGTFKAGLWMADFIGVSCSQKNLYAILPWSIREGATFGLLDSDKKPKPVYAVYKMFATLSKKHLIHSESVNSYVRMYCFKDDKDSVSLFALNWDTVSSYDATVHFKSILQDSTYHYKLPPQSLSCILFSPDFKNKTIVSYTPKSPPTLTSNAFSGQVGNIGVVKTFLDPKTSTLRIFSDRTLPDALVSMVSLQGRRLFAVRTAEIKKGFSRIPICFHNVPPGLYFLIVSSASDKPVETSKILLNLFY